MHGTCYLCGKVGDVAQLPSGSNACILCIWQYLSNDDDSEGAEVTSSPCRKECKECPQDKECDKKEPDTKKLDWTVEKTDTKDKEEEDSSGDLFPNWSWP